MLIFIVIVVLIALAVMFIRPVGDFINMALLLLFSPRVPLTNAGNEKTPEVRIKELENILFEILECPQWIDKATIPKGGIDVNPQQVVVNMSVGYVKFTKARQLLGMK